MMTKDKKPFTYTPGGIDLSQIRSERMAKRLARNAQSEGATGASQQNRPVQPQSPGGGAASAIGAAAMGMPFQVLPPPPPPQSLGQTGKNGTSAAAPAAPPPPPPQQPSTLAPPTGRLSAPGSPATARKSPTPQRFEPPPLGFRPEIKIPPNPMAALRKVPPPVEKNTFWKDEYCKDRSKSPLAEVAAGPTEGYTNGNGNSSSNSPSDVVDGEDLAGICLMVFGFGYTDPDTTHDTSPANTKRLRLLLLKPIPLIRHPKALQIGSPISH